MGYSISIQCNTQEGRDKMLAFLEQQYRPINEVLPAIYQSAGLRGPFNHPSYDRKAERILGFDYGPISGSERDYSLSILAWAALKVGEKKSGMFGIRYDGAYEFWPIHVRPDPTTRSPADREAAQEGIIIDALGWKPYDPLAGYPATIAKQLLKMVLFRPKAVARENAAIRAELLRLDQAWAKT